MRPPKHTSRALALSTVLALVLGVGAVAAHPALLGQETPPLPLDGAPARDAHAAADRPHKAPREGGGIAGLALLVGKQDNGSIAPAAGASVLVERYVPAEAPEEKTTARPNGTWEHVLDGVVDEHGTFATALPTGPYRVTVSDGEHTAVRLLRLHEDTWMRIVLGADGPRTMHR